MTIALQRQYLISLAVYLIFFGALLTQGRASAQSRGLVPSQTIAGVEFTVRAASLEMMSPGPGNSAAPTARFSIAVTNRNQSSVGLIIDAGPSGASTDTGLDLKTYSSIIARGFRICDPCKNIPDFEWVVLQPGQADNIVIGFWTRVPEPQRHRRAEAVDLSVILLIKEGSGETRQGVLSYSDIPIRNEIQ